jgi:rubrerythrin
VVVGSTEENLGCSFCGYVFDEEPPEKCPVCRNKKDKFQRVS